MSKNGLNLVLTAKIDEVATKNNIQSQLNRIGKQMDLGVGIDATQLKSMTKQIEAIQKKLANTKISPINQKDSASVKEIFTSVEKAVDKYKELGQIKVNKTSINPLTNEVEKFNLAITDATGKVNKLYFENAKLNKSMTGLSGFALTGKSVTDNSQQIRERQLQTEQKINTQIAQQNDKLKNQLELFKQEMQMNARNLSARNNSNSNFNNGALNSWLSSVDKLTTATPNLNHQMDRLRLQFRDISSEARNTNNQVTGFNTSLLSSMGHMARFAVAGTLMFAPFSAMDKLISNMYEIDERLISINKILNNADMAGVFNTAAAAAYEYGRSITGALDSLGSISRLGFDQLQAEAINNQSLLLATVGEMSDVDAADGLVATYRQWGLEVEDLTKVVDSLNNVSNKTGATVEGLLKSLSKGSGVAKVAKVSFDEYVGSSAMLQETLKLSGEEVGNFYKTIYSRYMRDSSQNFIQSLGVQTKDANGEIRSATEVFRELSEVSKTLDSSTLNQLAQVLGGGWHNSKFLTMLSQQDRILQNTNASIDSYMSATNELSTFQEGLAYKTNNLVASFQELGWTISDSGGVRTGLVIVLETTTDLIRGFNALTESTHGLNIVIPVTVAGIYGIVKAAGALKLAITGVKSAFGIFSVGIVGVELLTSALMKSTNAGNLHTEALTEAAESSAKNSSQLKYLVDRYKDLESQSDGSATKQEELKDVLEQIQTIAPQLIESTGKYGDELNLNKDKADKYVESLKAMTAEQVAMAKAANEAELSLTNIDIEKEKDKLNSLKKEADDYLQFMLAYQDKYNVKAQNDAQEAYDKRIKALQEQERKAYQSGNDFEYVSIKSKLDAMVKEHAKYLESLANSTEMQEYADQMAKIQDLESKQKTVEERQKALDNLTSSTKDNTDATGENKDKVAQLAKETADLGEGEYAASDGVKTLSDKLKEAKGDFEALTKAVVDAAKAGDYDGAITAAQSDLYSEMAEQVEPLNGLLEKLAEGKEISANEAMNLIAKEKELGSMIDFSSGKVKINEKAVLKLRDAKLKSYKDMEKSVIAEAQNTANATLSKLKNYGIEIKAIQSLQDAKKRLADIQSEENRKRLEMYAMGGLPSPDDTFVSDMTNAYNSIQDVIDLYDQIDSLSGLVSQGLTEVGTSADSSSKSTDKSKYVTDKYKQSLEALNLELAKVQAIKNKYPQYSKKYQDALKQEIKLNEKQLKLNQQQTKDLEKQIKSGNIRETGKVTTSSTTTSYSGSSYSGQYSSYINQAASKYGVDPNLVAAIIKQESGFNAKARSHAGAMGLMQLMPGTARGLGVSNAYDPYENIMGGTKYIKQMLDANNGDIRLALASYNAGLGNVRKYGGIPPFAETQNYVKRIMANYSGSGTGSTTKTSISNDAGVADKAQAIDNAKSNVNSLKEEALQIQQQIQQLNMDLIDSVLAGFDNAKAKLEDDLAQIDLVQSMEMETSKKWVDQQLKKEKLVRQQLDTEQKSIKYLKDQIKNNKSLTEAQKALLDNQLIDRTKEMIALEQQLVDERKNMADTIIGTYKDSLEAMKDAQVKKIDDMIDEINKKDDDDKYAKDLSKAQEKRQKILDDISKFSLDDTMSSKVKELQEELADMDESIADMQSDREKQVRIDNLNNQKDKIETDYQDLVNDERKFAKMRSDIINGNASQIQKDLNKYFSNIKANSNIMGKALSNNLIDLINQANRYLNGKDYKPIKIASFDTGGETKWAGNKGKLAILHSDEKILNKDETKEFKESLLYAKQVVESLNQLDKSKLVNVTVNVPQAPAGASNVSNTTNNNSSPTIHLRIGGVYGTDPVAVNKEIEKWWKNNNPFVRIGNKIKSQGGNW